MANNNRWRRIGSLTEIGTGRAFFVEARTARPGQMCRGVNSNPSNILATTSETVKWSRQLSTVSGERNKAPKPLTAASRGALLDGLAKDLLFLEEGHEHHSPRIGSILCVLEILECHSGRSVTAIERIRRSRAKFLDLLHPSFHPVAAQRRFRRRTHRTTDHTHLCAILRHHHHRVLSNSGWLNNVSLSRAVRQAPPS